MHVWTSALCTCCDWVFSPQYAAVHHAVLTVCVMLCASMLQVHAEGEAEHAAIGHNAVLNLVPREHIPIMQQAMADHDRDFAVFYNRMAELLEGSATQ